MMRHAVLLVLAALPAWSDPAAVRLLPLDGDAARASHEYSGLDWWGDHLVLLPENPAVLFTITREALAEAIATETPAPLEAGHIPVTNPEVFRDTPCFDGLEGIAIHGDDVWLVTENRCGCEMSGYVLHGVIAGEPPALHLDKAPPTEVTLTHQRCNMGLESILIDDDRILVLEESNGANLVDEPMAAAISRALDSLTPLTIPSIEYRVTDATALDEERRFWVLNYLWPPERNLLDPAADQIDPEATEPIPPGTPIERLMELQLRDDRVDFTDKPPLYLDRAGRPSRNWEGIVRWGDEGFLILTDEHPETILAFVPLGKSPGEERE